jgi:hypothetical protein
MNGKTYSFARKMNYGVKEESSSPARFSFIIFMTISFLQLLERSNDGGTLCLINYF